MVSSGSNAGCTTVHPLPTPSVCPYACAGGGMHCPTTEPLELIVAARQQRDRWVPSFEAVEARVAHDLHGLRRPPQLCRALSPRRRAGTLSVVGKGSRREQLPLPVDV